MFAPDVRREYEIMKFLSALLLAASLATPVAKCTEAAAITNSDFVVARGKGFQITRREMNQVIATAVAKNPGDHLPPDAELRVLSHLIEIRLVLQQAPEAEKAEGKKKADANF